MKTIKGPAIFLAQFAGDDAPFNTLDAHRRAGPPAWATRACRSRAGTAACSTWKRRPRARPTATRSRARWPSTACEITELSTHLQGQLVAVHPAYDAGFDGFAARRCAATRPSARQWAVRAAASYAAKASAQPGPDGARDASPARWPGPTSIRGRSARPGLIETAFDELARRWRPILDAFDEAGVDVCYEIHPGEDLHDGVTYEMFLERVGSHPRACLLYDPSHFVLQQLDYLDYIDIYHERIKIFHVKDAEFNPTGRQGVYGGFQSWVDRAGRFRSLGDGQVDFGAIFSKMAAYDFAGWAVLEWECCLKHPEDGAREGATFIADAHHPRDRAGVRRLRRRRRRPGGEPKMLGIAERERHDDRRRAARRAARIRLGMVGGGQGAFIGARAPHGGAARRPLRAGRRRAVVRRRRAAAASAAELRLAPERSYADYRRHGSARGGARRRHRRRRHRHAQPPAPGRIASAFLDAGIDVICDKPLTTTLAEALDARRQRCATTRPPVRADAQLHRLSDGAPGARDGRGRRARRASAWSRPSTRRTG